MRISDWSSDVCSSDLLGDMLSADVLAEMNDYVREELIDLLAPEQVAELASELDTDDAVAIIADMEADEQQAVLDARSEEHTSELQSLMRHSYAVFCLKIKKNNKPLISIPTDESLTN